MNASGEHKPEPPARTPPNSPSFPAGFSFGAATGAHQIEGAHDEDGGGPSVQDTFGHTPGTRWTAPPATSRATTTTAAPRTSRSSKGHLHAPAAAIDAGVDVRGYSVWSLLDDFAWARGYGHRFGIVHVDHDHGAERITKTGYAWYRDLIAAHRARTGTRS